VPLAVAVALALACAREDAGRGAAGETPPAATAATPAQVEPGKKEPGPRVPVFSFELEPKVVDLGTLRPDEDAKCDFTIVNTDARPLRILNVDGSCDCTSFLVDRTEIPPGGRRVVHVVIHAENRGSKLLKAFVQVNDEKVTTKEIEIQYVVLAELSFTPGEVAFGRRVVGSDGAADVVVRYEVAAGQPLQDLQPRIAPELGVTWTFGEPEVNEVPNLLRQVRIAMHLRLDGGKPVAAFRVPLEFTSSRHRPARLLVAGEVHPGWYLEHSQLHLGNVAPGSKGRGTLRLCWTVADPPKILALEGSQPELTATSAAEPQGRAYKIDVVLQPTKSGDFDGELRVRIDRAAEPLVVRVKARVP
jgi:hypothetical protein